MKDELAGKIMKEFASLRAKTNIYLTNKDEANKAKETKKLRHKRKT